MVTGDLLRVAGFAVRVVISAKVVGCCVRIEAGALLLMV